MAQQKQLIPGNTPLYNAEECDNNFVKCNGTSNVGNFTIKGDLNLNGNLKIIGTTSYDLNLGEYSNIICPDTRTNAINLITHADSWDNIKGAGLSLCTPDHITDPGCFKLLAKNSSGRYELQGSPNGKLMWGNNHLVQSVNGNKADAEGNISIDKVSRATDADKAEKDSKGNVIETTYVNLASVQTITGNKTFSKSPNIPNPPNNSNTNIAASTKWVNDKINDKINNFKRGGIWTKLVDAESFNWWDDYPNGIILSQSCLDFDYLVICLDSDDSKPANNYYLNWFPNFILRCSASAPASTDMSGKYRILTVHAYNNTYKVQFTISSNGKEILKPGTGGNHSYESSICTGIYGVNVWN